MRPFAAHVTHVVWSVCLCVEPGHTDALCKKLPINTYGWTDRDAVMGTDSCRPVEPYVSRLAREPLRAILRGCLVHWKASRVRCGVRSKKDNNPIVNNGMQRQGSFSP